MIAPLNRKMCPYSSLYTYI